MTTVTALALGAGVGLGLVLIIAAFLPAADAADSTTATTGQSRVDMKRAGVALVAGVVAAWLTGWPVAFAAAAGLTWAAPALSRVSSGTKQHIQRIEAVAAWAESLRDCLGAAGLEQAIMSTARHAPPAIRHEVRDTAEALTNGSRLPDALRAFADRLADPTADVVAASLIMAHNGNAANLAATLSRLATTARARAAADAETWSRRARVYTSARVTIGITLTAITILLVFNADFMAPLSSINGQIVVGLAMALIAVSLYWIVQAARPVAATRILAPIKETA